MDSEVESTLKTTSSLFQHSLALVAFPDEGEAAYHKSIRYLFWDVMLRLGVSSCPIEGLGL